MNPFCNKRTLPLSDNVPRALMAVSQPERADRVTELVVPEREVLEDREALVQGCADEEGDPG